MLFNRLKGVLVIIVIIFFSSACSDVQTDKQYYITDGSVSLSHRDSSETLTKTTKMATDDKATSIDSICTNYIPISDAFDTINMSGIVDSDCIDKIISKIRYSDWDTLSDILSPCGIQISAYVDIRRVDLTDSIVDVLTNYEMHSNEDFYVYISSTEDTGLYNVLLVFYNSGDGEYLIQKCMLMPPLKDVSVSFVGEFIQLSYEISGTGLNGMQTRWYDSHFLENKFFYNSRLDYTFSDEPYTVHIASTHSDTEEENISNMRVDIDVKSPNGKEVTNTSIFYKLRYDTNQGVFYDDAQDIRYYQADISSKEHLLKLLNGNVIDSDFMKWLNR